MLVDRVKFELRNEHMMSVLLPDQLGAYMMPAGSTTITGNVHACPGINALSAHAVVLHMHASHIGMLRNMALLWMMHAC